MRTFGVVVDGLVNLNFKNFIFKDASIVPLSFMMGSNQVIEGTISNEELFKGLKKLDYKLNTPSTESIIHALNEQKKLGYKNIIYIASSKYFTDSFRQATLSKKILNDESITIIDSKTFGPGIEYMLEIINYYESKCSYEELIKKIYEAIDKIQILIISKSINKVKLKKVISNIIPLYEAFIFNEGFESLGHVKKQDIPKFLSTFSSKDLQLGSKPYVKVMSAKSYKDAKILQHELHTLNKEIQLSNYGEIPFIVSYRIGLDAEGILYSNYGGL